MDGQEGALKSMKRKVIWFVLNTATFSLLWATIHFQSRGMGRVTMFLMWSYSSLSWAVATLLLLATVLGWKAEMHNWRNGRSVPGWISFLSDIVAACFCAYLGWPVTAFVWISQQIPELITFNFIPGYHKKQHAESKPTTEHASAV